jgi:hypothetical protein
MSQPGECHRAGYARAAPTTAFTFAGGVYQILTVPSLNVSIATGINSAGLIVGVHEDLAGVAHGFAKSGGTFSNVDFPGATATQAIGVTHGNAERISATRTCPTETRLAGWGGRWGIGAGRCG